VKILQLCTKVPFPPKDGGAKGVYAFAHALCTLGHTVTVLAINPPKHFISNNQIEKIPEGIHIYAEPVDTSAHIFAALKNLLLSSQPYQVERFIDSGYRKKLIELLTSNPPDIVQLEGIYLSPYIPVIRQYSKAKIVLRAHNIEFLLWKDIAKQENNIAKKAYYRIQSQRLKEYEISSINKVDGITALTEHDVSSIKRWGQNNTIKLIPFGIPIKPDTSPYIADKKNILYIGALDWIPNQKAILWFVKQVWPSVIKKHPTCTLHIAGRNAPPAIARNLKKAEGVHFHGEIDNTEIFFSLGSIMVVPLFSGSGMRVKIVEAMQKGKIILATSKAIEGIPAIPGIHYISANKKNEFRDALRLIFSDCFDLKTLSFNAQSLINEKFNILAITSDLIDFYSKIKNA
jgi:glycosyltransferase involved in cell wall biosynthesis